MADTTRKYEGMFLFGTAATADVDEALGTIRSFIEKHNGNVLVLRKWDDRKFAYEVEKQTRGLYVLSFFEAPPTAVDAIRREVNLSDTVLRCLITDGSHLSVAEVEAMEPQRPEPRELDEEGRPVRRRRPTEETAEETAEVEGGEGEDETSPSDEPEAANA